MELLAIITRMNLKKLVLVPIGMLLIASFILASNYRAGTIPMSIELKGGTLITAYNVPNGGELEAALEENFGIDFKFGTVNDLSGNEVGRTIETNVYLEGAVKDEITTFLVSRGVPEEEIAIKSVGPSLSARFLREAVKAVLFAFLFMAAVVFIRFKALAPSLAVVLSAFSDIVTTIAVMILLGIQLSPGSFVALLLLIGYSVDTDIVLATRILVRKIGSFEERLEKAMKTGLTMTVTTLSAVVILLLVATSEVLREIAVVLLIGLLVDLVNTWLQNARILQWYAEKQGI
ncbi:MAG: protein translocase subunit SecF [Candidatus Hydrothermarchaeales archaeon]